MSAKNKPENVDNPMENSIDYITNENFCVNDKMNDALVSLFLDHRQEKILTSCKTVISEMKTFLQSNKHDSSSWILEVEKVENCFFQIFLSNCKNVKILPAIVEALSLLMTMFGDVKDRLVAKGIFFNIDSLLHHFCERDKKQLILKYGYRLAIALTETTSENLKNFMETNIIMSIKSSLLSYNHDGFDKEVIALCLCLISILILKSETDDDEISQLKQKWCNQFFPTTDRDESTIKSVLDIMNHFVDAGNVQQHGLTCLLAFTTLDDGIETIYEFGGLDTSRIALMLNLNNSAIFIHSFQLITKILMTLKSEDLVNQEVGLFEIISKAIQSSVKNTQHLVVICDCLLVLLLVGVDLCDHVKNLPLLLFQTFNNLPKEHSSTSGECHIKAHRKLAQCLYLIMSKTDDDIRNAVLHSACYKNEVQLALFCIFLGANINDTIDKQSRPLAIACQNEDEAMVKHLLILISTFCHIRLLPCRIDEVHPSLHTSIQKHNDQITAALLWYLLNRDTNGVAEWSNCHLSRLKTDWLEVAFTSQNSGKSRTKCDNLCLEAIQQFNSYQIGMAVIQSASTSQSNTTDASSLDKFIEEKFEQTESIFDGKRCPLQRILTSVESSSKPETPNETSSCDSSSEDEEKYELMDMYKCPRCSGYVAYREYLKFSFDEETLLEESIHENRVEACTCAIVFPPPHVSANEVEEIQLSRNKLTSLDGFSFLSSPTKKRLNSTVKRINLLDNHLTEMPVPVAQIFGSLVELNLSQNQLVFFPFHVLAFCSHLEVLDVSGNMLHAGTYFLSNPASSNSHIAPGSNLPEDFRHGLKTLKMENNAYCNFPIWIFETFPNLEHLDMKKNAIENFVTKDLLREMAAHTEDMCSCLKHLDLSQNHIHSFCTYILNYAQNLKHLDVSKNELTEVENCPEEVLCKSKLSYVDFSSNQLAGFPLIVSTLPRLKCLLLNNNGISECSDPSVNWRSRSLQHLDLSSNDLTDVTNLAALLVDNWPSTLKVLSLAHNAIGELPPALGKLNALEMLDISDNDLYELPDQLGDLSNLKSFILHDNELDLEETILKGSAQEIRQFLYARLKKSVPQNRVKLILVGDPGAGKTTLLQSLKVRRIRTFSRDQKSNPTLATIGVNVVKVDMTHENRPLQLSVWDFAGQEDFYATHPCFISEHAMYIALYDASKGPDQLETLKPWLTAIHARAKHCPVLVIGSHADRLPWNKQLEITHLKQKLEEMSQESWFPRGVLRAGIINPYLYDVRENSSRISQLKLLILDTITKAKIQERMLVGNMVPYSYVQLSELLEKEADKRPGFPVITFKDLVDLLQDPDSENCPEFDSWSELMLAVKYLHQTGFLLHFDDPRSRLQDYFFIRPAWLCKLLAEVVTLKEDVSSKIRYIDKDGILSKTQFAKHFTSSKLGEYPIPNDFYPQLFRILENFEVLLSQGNDRCLVPSKLPEDKPNIKLPVEEVQERLTRYFSLVYTPMGLWPRLLARLLAFGNKLLRGFNALEPEYTFATPKKWQEGVYFEWNDTNLSPKWFALIQSGSEEYDKARKMWSNRAAIRYSAKDDAVKNHSLERKKKEKGIEVIVPRSPAGVLLLARLVDHITSLVEEWYPGLMNPDLRGRSLFQQYAPCFVCYDEALEVHCFCIDTLAKSILCNGHSVSTTDAELYKTRIGRSSEVLLVECRNHKRTPVPLMFLAPEINLDDFDKSLRLDPEHLSFEPISRHILGEGGFGVVYQAVYKNEDVAVKTFLTKDENEMAYKKLRAELNVLAQHQHPSIISFRGFIPPASSTKYLPLLAMEYAKLGSLGKLLSKMTKLNGPQRKSALSRTIRHRIAYEVAEGLCFLHRQNIVYRDLKPDNILLTSLNSSSITIAKITDYGISIHAAPFGIPGATGSPGYSAPEVANLRIGGRGRHDLYPYSLNCDVYSYGLVLHELAVGRSPWVDYVYQEHFSGVGTGDRDTANNPDEVVSRGIVPSPISTYEGALAWPYAQELVTDCLKRNPEERPTSCQIVALLSNVQSCCFRSQVTTLPKPVFSKTYRNANTVSDKNLILRCTSCKDGEVSSTTQQNQSTMDTYYSSQIDHDTSKWCNIVKVSFDIEKGRVKEDDEWLTLDPKFTVSCMLQAPRMALNKKAVERKPQPFRVLSHRTSTDSNPIIVAGTQEGHLLIIQSKNKIVKNQFPSAVTALHFHRSQEKKSSSSVTEGYVIIGLEDGSLVAYTLDQITDAYNKQPLSVTKLSDEIGVAEPVRAMDSIESTLYVVCANKIVFLSLADSGGPIVRNSIETFDRILCFTAGSNHFYGSYRDVDKVQVWSKKGFCQKVLEITTVLMQRPENIRSFSVTVTSIFLDNVHSALWVGTSAGHVVVYAESSRYEVLTVLHRHSGPVQNFFLLSGDNSECEVVACLGQGFRPVTLDIDRSKDAPFSPNFSPHVDESSMYLTLWDADLPKQAPVLASVLKARKNLSGKN